jgi:hypothetical protein
MLNNLFLTLATMSFRAVASGPYQRFQQALKDPEAAQKKVLRTLLADLAKTHYGQEYGITGQEDYSAFASKLPLQDYETMEPWIQKQLETTQPIITPHRIIHSEPTSGSSGPVKRIPYTRPHLASFSNMFAIWVYDLLAHGFQPKTGRIFMSISPPTGKMRFIDEGFEDERSYLNEPMRSLVSNFLVLPPKGMNGSNFQDNLAFTLLNEKHLEVISIWSPSYLLVLLDYIRKNRQRLANSLPKARRKILLSSQEIEWETLWPDLQLISCWNHALAAPLAHQIRALFPNVHVQGKGLLATEAAVTLPLTRGSGCFPLLTDVFLEFETENGTLKQLHELSDGEQAQVVITQRAGLSRYRLHDLVTVVRENDQNTPSLVFVGRTHQVSDLVGEKLHEQFVSQSLLPILPSGGFFLVPYQEASHRGYVLLSDTNIEGLAEMADRILCQAHHYQLARNLGQLAPLRVCFLPDLLSKRQTFYRSEGLKLGNIKDATLVCDPAQGKRLLDFLRIDMPSLLDLEEAVKNSQLHPIHPPPFPLQAGA